MAVSQQLETVTQMWTSFGEKASPGLEEARAASDELATNFKLADDVKYERVNASGVPCEWISTPGAAEDRVVLYIHGGAYITCSVSTHREMVSRISRASGARVLSVDYRLAPEHPFPAAVEDCTAAYRWLLSNGVNPAKMAVAGDSAGGGLTLATLVAMRDAGQPMPAAAVCFSPWVDLEALGDSMETKAELDPLVQREPLLFMAGMYIADGDPRNPLAAPLYADLHGLPPMLIHVGTSETLLDDSTRITERLKGAGVDVTLDVWDDMVHVWQMFAAILPEAQQSLEGAGEFIRKHTG